MFTVSGADFAYNWMTMSPFAVLMVAVWSFSGSMLSSGGASYCFDIVGFLSVHARRTTDPAVSAGFRVAVGWPRV